MQPDQDQGCAGPWQGDAAYLPAYTKPRSVRQLAGAAAADALRAFSPPTAATDAYQAGGNYKQPRADGPGMVCPSTLPCPACACVVHSPAGYRRAMLKHGGRGQSVWAKRPGAAATTGRQQKRRPRWCGTSCLHASRAGRHPGLPRYASSCPSTCVLALAEHTNIWHASLGFIQALACRQPALVRFWPVWHCQLGGPLRPLVRQPAAHTYCYRALDMLLLSLSCLPVRARVCLCAQARQLQASPASGWHQQFQRGAVAQQLLVCSYAPHARW